MVVAVVVLVSDVVAGFVVVAGVTGFAGLVVAGVVAGGVVVPDVGGVVAGASSFTGVTAAFGSVSVLPVTVVTYVSKFSSGLPS